jgi:hypothetical protein
MEKAGLVLVLIMLLSFLSFSFSVGKITGLISSDLPESPEFSLSCEDRCIEEGCTAENITCAAECKNECTSNEGSNIWKIFNPIKELIN